MATLLFEKNEYLRRPINIFLKYTSHLKYCSPLKLQNTRRFNLLHDRFEGYCKTEIPVENYRHMFDS